PACRRAQEPLLLDDLLGDGSHLAAYRRHSGERRYRRECRQPERQRHQAQCDGAAQGFRQRAHAGQSSLLPGTTRAVMVKLSPSPSANVVGAENWTSAKWPDASIRPISAAALAALPASRTVPCSTSSRVSQASSGSARLKASS